MNTSYDAGFRGVRQIYKSACGLFPDNAERILERYTGRMLERTCPGWLTYG